MGKFIGLSRDESIDIYMEFIVEMSKWDGIPRDDMPEPLFKIELEEDLLGLEGEVFHSLKTKPDKLLTIRETAELLVDNVGVADRINIETVFTNEM